MSEERTDEPFAVQEIWLDGFSGLHIHDETLRCTAFSMQDGRPVAVVKLIMKAKTARQFCADASDALTQFSKLRASRRRRSLG